MTLMKRADSGNW